MLGNETTQMLQSAMIAKRTRMRRGFARRVLHRRRVLEMEIPMHASAHLTRPAGIGGRQV